MIKSHSSRIGALDIAMDNGAGSRDGSSGGPGAASHGGSHSGRGRRAQQRAARSAETLINRFEKKSENLCAANRELHERIQVLEARDACCTCRGGEAVKVEVARRHEAARPFLRAQVTAKHLVPSVVRSSVRDKLSRDAAEHTADNDACAHDATLASLRISSKSERLPSRVEGECVESGQVDRNATSGSCLPLLQRA